MKLLKTMVVVTLVVGLLLGGVLPVQADTGVTSTQPSLPLKPDWGKGRWALGKVTVIRGEVTGKGANQINVDGETVLIDEGTKIKVPTLGSEASFDDIEVGVQVVVLAYKEDDTLHARHIVVIPGKPQFRHHVGQVTEYTPGMSTTDGSITIKDKSENTTTFTIIDGKFKILPPGHDEPKIGDRVTVISHRDPVQDKLIAVGVVVHPERPVLGDMLRMGLQGLAHIDGTIQVDESADKITISLTEIYYDGNTIVILRGLPDIENGLEDNQTATIFYRVQADGTKLAKFVLVGIDLPGITAELEED